MRNSLAGQWHQTSLGIIYVVADSVQFDDDLAHWRDGFCRLLEISDRDARDFIETAVQVSVDSFAKLLSQLSPEQRVEMLKIAVREHFGLSQDLCRTPSEFPQTFGTTFDGIRADTIFASSISGNKERQIVGARGSEFAWQIDSRDCRPVKAASVVYDSSYFDSPIHRHYGMKDYVRHEDWRMEKARRLMQVVLEGSGERAAKWKSKPRDVKVLDVGSALGYFRKAMDELGFKHFGLDVSHDAIELCRERFGFDTWQGTVSDLPAIVPSGYLFDIITLWDTIEHLDDPLTVAELLKGFLNKDGIIVIRTPNLMAFEADILKDMYYSYKLDHIRYFSARSLDSLMTLVDLKQIYMETTSHLFKGIFGADYLYQMGKQLKGADILAVYSK